MTLDPATPSRPPWHHVGVICERRGDLLHVSIGIDGHAVAQRDFCDVKQATYFIAQAIWGYLKNYDSESKNEQFNDTE